MSKEKQRLTFITVAQIFSMLLIVLSHSVPLGARDWMKAVTPYLQLCGLPVFMTLSGFLVSYTKQLEKYGYKKFVIRRSLRLLLPYFAISICMLLPKYLIGRLTGTSVSLSAADILYQLITPREGILPHLWFLLTLWILCIMVPLFQAALKNKLSMCAWLCMTLASVFIPKATNVLALGDVQIYAFWFCLGLIIGGNTQFIEENKRIYLALCTIGGGYILTRILWGQSKFTWFLYSAFCLMTVLLFSKYAQRSLEKACTFVGKYSFTIYILSLPVQNVADIVLNKMGIVPELAYVVLFILGLVVPVAVAMAAELIDRKVGKKCLGNMIGL